MQVEDGQLVLLDALDPADEALFVDDELVDVHRRQVVGELHAMPGTAVVLAGLDLAHAVPERAGEGMVAARQQGHVVDQLVGVVVLRVHPAGARLQAHVDVLGHQHHAHAAVAALQLDQLVDDLVVVEVLRQPGDGLGTLAHEDRQAAAGAVLATLDRYPSSTCSGVASPSTWSIRRMSLAALGGDGVLSGLQLVQLFEHRHRDRDAVFPEVQQGIRIVDQDIGIEDVQGGLGGAGTSVVIHTRSPSAKGLATECRVGAPPGRAAFSSGGESLTAEVRAGAATCAAGFGGLRFHKYRKNMTVKSTFRHQQVFFRKRRNTLAQPFARSSVIGPTPVKTSAFPCRNGFPAPFPSPAPAT